MSLQLSHPHQRTHTQLLGMRVLIGLRNRERLSRRVTNALWDRVVIEDELVGLLRGLSMSRLKMSVDQSTKVVEGVDSRWVDIRMLV